MKALRTAIVAGASNLAAREIFLGVTTAFLAACALAACLLTLERQQVLLSSTRYSNVFAATQGSMELSRLQADLGASLVPSSGVGPDEVALGVSIMRNRIGLLRHGMKTDPILAEALDPSDIDALERALETVEAVFQDPGNADAATTAMRALQALNPGFGRVAGIAHQIASLAASEQQQQLSRIYWSMLWVILGLVFCGCGLLLALKRRHDRMRRLAHVDSLTGLPNRLTFYEELRTLFADRQPRTCVTVMLVDVDLFKHVNDTLGHGAGDQLLAGLGLRLRNAAPDARIVARLGGDEFALIFSGLRNEAECLAAAEVLCDAAKEPFTLEGRAVTTGISIGVASGTPGAIDAETLFKNADLALNAGKAGGRGRACHFHPGMARQLELRQLLEDELRDAIEQDALELFFQPIMDLKTGQPHACEALLRWRHPVRGFISPAEFIPLAEESGMIHRLGAWVLRRACEVATTWPEHVRVAVNISPRQFVGNELVPAVFGALEASGLAPHRLELEITESVLLGSDGAVEKMVAEIREWGVRLALDDFGTGYASLSYLTRLPFDKIKIDQSFVRDMPGKVECGAVVETICQLAERLGMVTTAEGIETEEHLRLAVRAGCFYGQGYLFDRPLSERHVRDKLMALCASPSHPILRAAQQVLPAVA